jgi:hypothetical protein
MFYKCVACNTPIDVEDKYKDFGYDIDCPECKAVSSATFPIVDDLKKPFYVRATGYMDADDTYLGRCFETCDGYFAYSPDPGNSRIERAICPLCDRPDRPVYKVPK